VLELRGNGESLSSEVVCYNILEISSDILAPNAHN